MKKFLLFLLLPLLAACANSRREKARILNTNEIIVIKLSEAWYEALKHGDTVYVTPHAGSTKQFWKISDSLTGHRAVIIDEE
jgi:hypothetical protein